MKGYNPVMRKKKLNKVLKIAIFAFSALALMVGLYFVPPIHDRLHWRLLNIWADIYYFFNPIGGSAFSPGQQAQMEEIVNQTLTALAITPTETIEPSSTPTNFVTFTSTPSPSPTPTSTPLPESFLLEGVKYEKETFNNCGPASLSMLLSFWGWNGNQAITGEWLKPNWQDRNVMPYEMLDYVQSETNLKGLIRYGGDLEILKTFIANGFPILIERGFEDEVPQDEWMGHYGVLTAYNDAERYFLIQDAYVGPDYARSYDYIERFWPSFQNIYLILYPPNREAEVLSILGPHADPTYNLEVASQKALEATGEAEGRDSFFAWYSYGTSLYLLNDYFEAARAYDRAFEIKNQLWPDNPADQINENDPWRITWYQTGPYFAYYYTNRFQDVIDLANETFKDSIVDAIEESWVWRGRAKVRLGDVEGAIEDFRKALEWHPGWWVAEEELRLLGVEP